MNEQHRDQPALRFHDHIAHRLVELAQPKSGDMVLDLIDGVAVTTFYAAPTVEPTGKVITLDLRVSGGAPVDLPFAPESFDCLLCASALFLLSALPVDRVAVLRACRRVLKPGGTVAFSGYGDQTFQPLVHLFETDISRYTLLSPPMRPGMWQRLTALEQYSDLLRNAGFSVLDVRSEHHGYDLATPEEWWDIIGNSALRERLARLPTASVAQFKVEHLAAVAALATAHGISLNVVAIFAIGQK